MERARLGLLRALGHGEPAEMRRELDAIGHRLLALPPGRVDRLARRLRLDLDDVALLWTTVAVCHDPRCAAHAAALLGGDHVGGATLALHMLVAELDPGTARRMALRLTANHPLIRDRVVSVHGTVPGRRSYIAPDRIAAWLHGEDALDPELQGVGTILRVTDELVESEEQQELVDTLAHLLTEQDDALVFVEGPPGVGKRTMIARAADVAGKAAVCVDAMLVQHSAQAVELLLGALARELLVRERVVGVIANVDVLLGGDLEDRRLLRQIGRMLGRMPASVIATGGAPSIELPCSRTVFRLRASAPSTEARIELWRRALGEDSGIAAEPVAMRFGLGPGEIVAARRAAVAYSRSAGSPRPTGHDIVEGVRAVIAERLSGLATRVEPRHGWNDLVLSPDTLDQVRALVARVQHAHTVLDTWGMRSRLPRGAGVAALFSGPPGTGKTMVAGVIARELELELYQVDLSKVVSKWVGETEKQLSQIFDAAEAGHALLLFDEADALFAKRTEVKAAVDRYANMEVNYLLQRVEAFGGVTVLTTNMDTSIDPALMRRLAGHVVFWPPEEDERIVLWAKMIPDTVPREGVLDFESLGSDYPDMTGANIRNAAVAATFLAASEQASLRNEHLQRAARSEYRAMGRVLGKRGRE